MDSAVDSTWELAGFLKGETTADHSVWPWFPACGMQGLAWPTLNVLPALVIVGLTGWWTHTPALLPGCQW